MHRHVPYPLTYLPPNNRTLPTVDVLLPPHLVSTVDYLISDTALAMTVVPMQQAVVRTQVLGYSVYWRRPFSRLSTILYYPQLQGTPSRAAINSREAYQASFHLTLTAPMNMVGPISHILEAYVLTPRFEVLRPSQQHRFERVSRVSVEYHSKLAHSRLYPSAMDSRRRSRYLPTHQRHHTSLSHFLREQ